MASPLLPSLLLLLLLLFLCSVPCHWAISLPTLAEEGAPVRSAINSVRLRFAKSRQVYRPTQMHRLFDVDWRAGETT